MDNVSSVGPSPSGGDSDNGSGPAERRTPAQPSSGPAGVDGLESRAQKHGKGWIPHKLRRPSSSLQRAVLEEDITRAATLLADAESMEVDVSPQAVARHLGLTSPSTTRRALETMWNAIPRVTTEAQRIAQVEKSQVERAIDRETDVRSGGQMARWFDRLSNSQRQAVYVAPASEGGPHWIQPLTLCVHGQPDLKFEAEHLVNWPEHVVAQLPDEARVMLAARHETLSALNIDSGPAAAGFIEKHFERHDFDINDAPPREVARLVALHPQIGPMLQALQESGAKLTLVRCKQTPDVVLDAIRHVATNSQHKFVSTWLSRLVAFGIEPSVLEKDIEKVRTDNAKSKNAALKKFKNEPFRAALAARQHDDELDEKTDIQGSVKLIKAFSESAMYVTSTSPAEADGLSLRPINNSLREHFGSEYARRRMTFDDAKRTSESTAKIIVMLAVMSPMADLLQLVPHLDGIDKAVMAGGDDIAGEFSNWPALKQAGMTLREMLGRAGITAPIALAALAMANAIDEAVKAVGDHVGGAMYSLSAVALSFTTAMLSIRWFAKNYERLKRENKLPPNLNLNEETRALLDTINKRSVSKEDLLRMIDASLEATGASQAERAAVRDRLSRSQIRARKLLRQLRKHGELSMQQRPFAAGTNEAVAVNPATLGLMAGTLSSPLVGFAAGPWFLHQPLLYALAGSYETIIGAFSIWAFGRSFDARWNRFVRRRKPVDLPQDSQQAHGPTDTIDD
ncbi:hypothetical protein [Trinickia acidisoli]|uniref:hypothetical protein n=1 Tax=Trinickia acidisoli TaxID=2767482 RepID=UPI001A8F9E67|nr:hypothetical protein [Trinickia acidisoli]